MEWSVSRFGRLTPLRNIPRYTFIGGGVGPSVCRGALSIKIRPVVFIAVAALKGLFGECAKSIANVHLFPYEVS
jgi:hypothetical protein